MCGMVGCRAPRQLSNGNMVCLRKATTTNFSSPKGWLIWNSWAYREIETEVGLLHLATVLGSIRSAWPPVSSFGCVGSLDRPPPSVVARPAGQEKTKFQGRERVGWAFTFAG
jgi:hypothetical protein